MGVDYYALSFVRDADVIYELKDYLAKQGELPQADAGPPLRPASSCSVRPSCTLPLPAAALAAAASQPLCCRAAAGLVGTSAIGVLAKIESADSVAHLDDILDAVDGAMVARGDLGAELPVEEVRGWLGGVLSWCCA